MDEIIESSGLYFLKDIGFEERTENRFFQKYPLILNNEARFLVILGPSVESPVHNHAKENMTETHLLFYGSGRFEIYDDKGEVKRKVKLQRGRFHEPFSTPEHSPQHKYVAGPEGSICLALEVYD